MSAHSINPAPLLRLPPEIRQDIFIAVFQSTIIRVRSDGSQETSSDGTQDTNLAILSVCSQFYREASPLAIPNAHVYCDSNAAVIDTLSMMSPAQIMQLRHLVVDFVPVGFNLLQGPEYTRQDDDGQEDNDSGEDSGIPENARQFHLGAILGLFPGLQLDLLEVFCGTGGGSCTHEQVVDCFGTLLEADGYRQLWMDADGGDVEWSAADLPSMRRWKGAFENRFRPHGGSVRFHLEAWEWPDSDRDPVWVAARDAGFTLLGLERTMEERDEYYNTLDESKGHINEDAAVIVLKRGDTADIIVKADDRRVLRCIERDDPESTPETYFEEASDALRKLFRERSWKSIKTMDGFDDGSLTYHDGPGNMIYFRRLLGL